MTEHHELKPVVAAIGDLQAAAAAFLGEAPAPAPSPEAAHAILSASGSERWLACAGSVYSESFFEDDETDFALEGTVAHDILSNKLFLHVGRITRDEFEANVAKLRQHRLYQKEMERFTDECRDYCIERYNRARAIDPHAQVFIETRLDFSRWVPRGYGRGDFGIAYSGVIEIIDFKYGKGKVVEVEKNSQMRLYAAGTFAQWVWLFNPKEILYTVHQPRIGNIATEKTTADELLHWLETEVAPKAKRAWAIHLRQELPTTEDYAAGKHCGFCKARKRCRTRAEYQLQMEAKMREAHRIALLTPEQIAELIPRMGALISWAKEVEETALELALDGTKIPGQKVVEGRSNRVILNHLVAAELLRKEGFTDAMIYKPSELLPLGDLETLVGKKRLGEVLSTVIRKPKGKPTLVSEHDKRPEWTAETNAASAFAQFIQP